MTVESFVLMLACVGSIGWIGFMIHYYTGGQHEAIRQRDKQIARLLEEINLQKQRADKEVADLKGQLEKKEDQIIDLTSRLRVAEMRLSIPGVIDQNDPLKAIKDEAAEKAKAYMTEAHRRRILAVEETGKKKARLLAEAEALESKAIEYQAIAKLDATPAGAFKAKPAAPAPKKAFSNSHQVKFEVVA